MHQSGFVYESPSLTHKYLSFPLTFNSLSTSSIAGASSAPTIHKLDSDELTQ